MKKSIIALFILQLSLTGLAKETTKPEENDDQKKLKVATRGIASTIKKSKKQIKLVNETIEISVK